MLTYFKQYLRDTKALLVNKKFSRARLFLIYNRLCIKNILHTKLFKVKTTQDGFMGYKVTYDNFNSFFAMFTEIFIHQVYMLPQIKSTEKLTIVDCGSNIGVSILFFKHFFPKSEIFCFEPDKETFKILEKNVRDNHLSKVRLFNKAIGKKKGKIIFYSLSEFKGGTGNTIYKDFTLSDGFEEKIVEEIPLSSLGIKKIDILKMDIEGAEGRVFEDLHNKGVLKRVDFINLEYHHGLDLKCNNLSTILKKIESAGFEYIINPDGLINDKISFEDFMKKRNYVLILHCFKKDKK